MDLIVFLMDLSLDIGTLEKSLCIKICISFFFFIKSFLIDRNSFVFLSSLNFLGMFF